MEVQIISKEIVKPSISTPQHLRTYNLSLLDQLAPPVYVPIILFYSANGENSYSFSVDCNDEDAPFIEAQVAGEMSMILEDPDINELEKLLPCNPHDVSHEISPRVIVAAQVNYFDCGGMAVSVCIWHAIADASAVASFLTSWDAIACGGSDDIKGEIFDCTSLFPPQDILNFSLLNFFKEDLLSKIMMKRFLFDSSKLAALREEIGNRPCLDRPTRFEAVAALIWGAVMATTGEENKNENQTETAEINAATIAVDLRKRMIPQLPKLSIGNINQVAMANCSKNDEKMLDYNGLAGKLHESIGKINNEYVRKVHAGGTYFQFLRKRSEELGKNPNLIKVFGFSSWCRFSFYEVDFGWGKPTWVGTALRLYKGIEAWVSLPKEDTVKFEQNPGICACSSFKPST
ncbi:hypothetical protein P3X46_014015 [Hevea brasiliensis]|uniref:Uncharacterized protein n=1 Tax=Hevea brasiliensis TaxID=3981 RepID=A0ABQ9M997_HEVBR|nr:hypothetical protein P3X46_014015 [Hevea brasiliensis]